MTARARTDEPTAVPSDVRQDIGEELALLTMLADKVAEQIKTRKAVIAESWPARTVVAIEMPNLDNPARPIKVGTIRADGGQGVARVSDRDAWTAWCVEHSPHNVVRQEERKTSWQLDETSRAALTAAVAAGTTEGFGIDRPALALAALEAAGYTLTKRTVIPAETLVRPAWEGETLKLTQSAGTPVTPGGEVPEGIEFVEPTTVVKPVVTIGKDDGMRARFVTEQRHKLAAITGHIIDTTTEETL